MKTPDTEQKRCSARHAPIENICFLIDENVLNSLLKKEVYKYVKKIPYDFRKYITPQHPYNKQDFV
jgi:hypothetical protein